MRKYSLKIFLAIVLISFAAVAFLILKKFPKKQVSEESVPANFTPSQDQNSNNPNWENLKTEELVSHQQAPLVDFQLRITKKPFGIFIDPETSPVQPERFRGFHTGTDFEIFSEELEKDVEVFSVCEGEVIQINYVSGYGGMIIQKCTLEDQPITVLYGHVDLTNATQIKIGEIQPQNSFLAMLAPEKSYYSGGERKHLHLGLHKGNEIDLRGYVQEKIQLESWIDFETVSTDF